MHGSARLASLLACALASFGVESQGVPTIPRDVAYASDPATAEALTRGDEESAQRALDVLAAKLQLRAERAPTTSSVELTIAPGNYDFGTVQVGSSATKAFTLTNTGTLPVTFREGYPRAFSLLTPDPFSYYLIGCGTGLMVGASCSIHVSFRPYASGQASGQISIQVNEGNQLFAASFYAIGGTNGTYQASIVPTPFDFGVVPIGSSATHSFTIYNTGDQRITFRAGYPRVGSTFQPEPFEMAATTCTYGLNPGASCTLDAKFAPAIAGRPWGYIWLYLNESTTLFSAALNGNDGSGGAYAVTATPSSVDFGQVALGAMRTQTFTITNVGTRAFPFDSYSPRVVTFDQGYAVSQSSCGPVLSVATTCSVDVTFAPARLGPMGPSFLSIKTSGSYDLWTADVRGEGVPTPNPIFSSGFE